MVPEKPAASKPLWNVMTGRVFISYRRGDGQAAAGRLFDRLLQHFDRDQLFMDVDAIEPGVDFVKSLDEHVASCIAFVAVIGPGWLSARSNDGSSRLDNPTDYVRIEIESALKRDIRVIPVLVDGATMPRTCDLPSSLQALARRNALEIAHHRFAADCDDLARGIKRAIGVATTPVAPAQPDIGSPAPNEEPSERLSWSQVLLSFKGRISRLQFLLGLIFTVAVFVAFRSAIMLTASSIFQGGETKADEAVKLLALFENRLTTILEVGFWCPIWALTLKRLRALGQGWKALLVFVGLDVLSAILDLQDLDAISTQVALFSLGLTFMLAAVKGTTGPGNYRHEPLGERVVPA